MRLARLTHVFHFLCILACGRLRGVLGSKAAISLQYSVDRHPLWHRYVEKHLNNEYRVVISRDNLSSTKAEEIESAWMAQSDGLVNWQNMGRTIDLKANDLFHKLRDANRALIQQARSVEKSDLAKAVQMYIQAIDAIAGCALING